MIEILDKSRDLKSLHSTRDETQTAQRTSSCGRRRVSVNNIEHRPTPTKTRKSVVRLR